MIVEKKIINSMLSNTITGDAWKKAMKDRDEAIAKRAEAEKNQKSQRARTSAELRQRAVEEAVELQMRRRNAEQLIKAGAMVTIGTDNYWAAAPEFTRGGTKPDAQNHGIGSIIAIEGLVELGMTPAQAIVAATKNGAIASRQLHNVGTVEKGKLADLLILDADPLRDISNLRKLRTVMRSGKTVDRDRLPTTRVLSR
jgi:imidazolonepropionase-like amidohydrolase